MNYIIFFDDTIKEIDDKIKEEIINEMADGAIGKEMVGSFYKFSDIRRILTEVEYKEQYPDKNSDMHQPYSDIPSLGFYGIINREKRLKGIELMAKGLKSVIDRRTSERLESPNATNLIDAMRARYKYVKANPEF